MAKARKETPTIPPKKSVKPANDAWTGMLAISLVSLILGCVLLFLDYSQYPEKEPPAVKKFVPAPPAPSAAAPPAAAAPAPAVPAPAPAPAEPAPKVENPAAAPAPAPGADGAMPKGDGKADEKADAKGDGKGG